MPVALTNPGVYIQEEPSAVHTITGVPTSVAAFVGFAPQGPVDLAVHVNSWAEYERSFGGLDDASDLSYAVFLFFVNGGSSAEIVRTNGVDANNKPVQATFASIKADSAVLTATSPGSWANTLGVQIDDTPYQAANKAAASPDQHLFDLTIADLGGTEPQPLEQYLRLTTTSIVTQLSGSQYLTVATKPAAPPNPIAPPASKPGDPPPDPKALYYQVPPMPEVAEGATPPKVPAGRATDASGDGIKPQIVGDPASLTGMYALDRADIFNMLCIPSPTGSRPVADLSTVAEYCAAKRAMLIVDPPDEWTSDKMGYSLLATLPVTGQYAKNAVVYFPNIQVPASSTGAHKAPCGAVAGLWAATDAARGVWKAPAGTAAGISGIAKLSDHVDDSVSGNANPFAVNCLRSLPLYGPVIWGARTCDGADDVGSQWKYLPVRRTALFIEESLRRGTQWIVFEPNDEPLWSSIRLNVGAFMNSLFRQGAFQGATPKDAYLVKCDSENNPQNDIDRGIVNILVGFAPLKPAEFVIIHIQQLAGQLQT